LRRVSEHEPYKGTLTEAGAREALHNIRRHRLVECFLVNVMRFGWHEVHDAADELGGSVSDTVVNRMDEMAGHPRRCPHPSSKPWRATTPRPSAMRWKSSPPNAA
jgi:DtxR family Mn-dependent transcriptional regulator